MKTTIALLVAFMAGSNAFVAPRVVTRLSSAPAKVSSVRMSSTKEAGAVSNVVNAEGLVRHPPGDVKLDQAVLDRSGFVLQFPSASCRGLCSRIDHGAKTKEPIHAVRLRHTYACLQLQ